MDVKTIQLNDGRQVGYREYGQSDGIPVLYFPGFPCTTFIFEEWIESISNANIRLIGIERPGYNVSSYQENRQLLDWPDDVIQVADTLQLEQFGVFGASGGGPYAVTCAYKIPERLTLTVVFAGLAPYDAFGLPEQLPSDTQIEESALQFIDQLKDPDFLIEQFIANEPEIVHDLLRSESMRKWVNAINGESFRNGIQGYAQDSKLLFAQPWEFALEDIKGNVQVWHGDVDKSVPLTHGQYFSEKIPNCSFHLLNGVGHVWTADLFGEILRTFLEVE